MSLQVEKLEKNMAKLTVEVTRLLKLRIRKIKTDLTSRASVRGKLPRPW